MYIINGDDKSLTEIDQKTFSEIDWHESDVEELLRKNIDIVCEDSESLLIIGQQVMNEVMARNDLMAIDNEGNIVLIEIKRDKADMKARKEAIEFQAIRYAASCSTIKDYNELLEKAFVPYVEKHLVEFSHTEGEDAKSIAEKTLKQFIQNTHISNFNVHQRIILVASEFDEQTISAVAWLVKNNIDIRCYTLKPYELDGKIFLDVDRLLQVADLKDYLIGLKEKAGVEDSSKITPRASKTVLPKIKDMIEWGVVAPGDDLYANDYEGNECHVTLKADGRVELKDGSIVSLQTWLKDVTKWSSVQTYAYTYHTAQGITLSKIRENYMSSDQYTDHS